VLSPKSDVAVSHITYLFNVFKKFRSIPFIEECYDLWNRVFGVSTNLSREAINDIRNYATKIGISLKNRLEVLEFIFITQTYLTIYMKLLVAIIAIKRGLVSENTIEEILTIRSLEGYELLSERIPFLRRAFEHDAFSWFVDPAKKDADVSQRLSSIIKGIAEILDKLDFSKVKIDLLRRTYQAFFDPLVRKSLGEFYTNENMVNEILDACNYNGQVILERICVDITCGSGTFLIQAIQRFIEEGRKIGLSNVSIIKKITHQIIGIDIHPFAVTMARVNYLLAISGLIDQDVRRVLGEIDLPIYWTDSLASFVQRPDPTGLPIVEIDVAPLGTFWLPQPTEVSWDHMFSSLKRAMDSKWDENRFLHEFEEKIRVRYGRTLENLYQTFLERVLIERDGRWISTLRNVTILDSIKGECHYVVGNPPWVRIHNVDQQLRTRISNRFDFFGSGAGWRIRFAKTRIPFREQADYSMAFVEAALDYLIDGGQLGFVITSNVIRSLYAGKMREYLIEKTTIQKLVDYSLSYSKLFEKALNAPLILSLQNREPTEEHMVNIEMINRLEDRMEWIIPQHELSLYKRDHKSPWLIAPLQVINNMRKMQIAGPKLGDIIKIHMGIKTSANPIYIIKDIKKTDESGIYAVRTQKGDSIKIEEELVHPFVRGRDVDAWYYKVEDYIIWTHDENGKDRSTLPPYATQYFERQEIKNILLNRSDYFPEQPHWIIFRVSKDKLKDKIAWQKIAKVIESTFLPAVHNDFLGSKMLIADSALYFIVPENPKFGYIITALLNSTLANAYVAPYVNRTGGAYCQYFAWILALLHIPKNIAEASELAEISQEIHEGDSIDIQRIDEIVGKYYDLSQLEMQIMIDYFNFFKKSK